MSGSSLWLQMCQHCDNTTFGYIYHQCLLNPKCRINLSAKNKYGWKALYCSLYNGNDR